MSGLVLKGVRIEAGGRTLLDGFALGVAPGEVVTVMGPSGCGKSSLLLWLAGTAPAGVNGSGRVALGGRRIETLLPEGRRLGLMLQQPLLFPHMDVMGNLLFALPRSLRGRQARRDAAELALAEVGLEGYGRRDPKTLSGGQQARVALARCLLARPTGLDRERRAEVRGFVLVRARDAGLPTLLVTHDREDAIAAGGRVIEPWAAQHRS